jgi:hypothetical protein
MQRADPLPIEAGDGSDQVSKRNRRANAGANRSCCWRSSRLAVMPKLRERGPFAL